MMWRSLRVKLLLTRLHAHGVRNVVSRRRLGHSLVAAAVECDRGLSLLCMGENMWVEFSADIANHGAGMEEDSRIEFSIGHLQGCKRTTSPLLPTDQDGVPVPVIQVQCVPFLESNLCSQRCIILSSSDCSASVSSSSFHEHVKQS